MQAKHLLVLVTVKLNITVPAGGILTDAAELEQLGLALPQMALLMHRLRQSGKDVPTDVFTVAAARDAILRMLEVQ